MAWFSKEPDGEIKSIVVDAANAYIERAQPTYRILSIKPIPTASEIAACWGAGAVTMAQAERDEVEPVAEHTKMLNSITREFYDNACQGLMENLGSSSVALRLDSKEVKGLIALATKQLTRERIAVLDPLMLLAPNACKLAAATISIFYKRLSKADARIAMEYALRLVRSHRDLNAFEAAKAQEWLANLDWSTP